MAEHVPKLKSQVQFATDYYNLAIEAHQISSILAGNKHNLRTCGENNNKRHASR